MRLSVAVMAACFAMPAVADEMFVDGQLQIVFHSTPCEIPKIVEALKAEGEVKRASIRLPNASLKGCYIKDEDGDFLLFDERGVGGWIPGKLVRAGA